jgi:hypothetical protein
MPGPGGFWFLLVQSRSLVSRRAMSQISYPTRQA